jgi:hypothetical protein
VVGRSRPRFMNSGSERLLSSRWVTFVLV